MTDRHTTTKDKRYTGKSAKARNKLQTGDVARDHSDNKKKGRREERVLLALETLHDRP